MGAKQSQQQPFDQEGVIYQKISILPSARQQAEKSPHKPLPGFAILSQYRPAIYPEAVLTRGKVLQTPIIPPPGRGVQLPVYRLIAMPGCYYQGQWQKGKPYGYGKVYAANGIYYQGGFEAGLASCTDGLLIYGDGSHYRGNFKDNCFHGKGKYVYKANKTCYTGQWQQDYPHGRGFETYPDGSRYQGEYKFGKKHGDGKYTAADGKILKGRFAVGQINSQGTVLVKGCKSYFDGYFENGMKTDRKPDSRRFDENKGKIITEYGIYSGKMVNGLMHDPNGKFSWHDGKQYRGGFQFGEMHGEGEIICSRNQVICGVWKRGKNIKIISLGNRPKQII